MTTKNKFEVDQFIDNAASLMIMAGQLAGYVDLHKKGYPIDIEFEQTFGDYGDYCKSLSRLLPIYRKLPGELFWRAFGATWAWCYDTWAHRRALLSLLNRHAHCSPARAFDDQRPITIYRGCSSRRVRGVSWSIDRQIAEQFAAGHRNFKVPNPVVATAQIARCDVFDYDNGQDEHEVIVNPRMLQSLIVERVR